MEPIDNYNPFAETSTSNNTNTLPGNQPASLPSHAIDTPVQKTSVNEQLNTTTQDLRRQQDELDRKAAELERREKQFQSNINNSTRVNNFPPLPHWIPFKPCFYQDINLDIPLEFQKLVRYHFYLWMIYACILLANICGAIALLAIKGNEAGSTLGLSILFFVLFTPLSFVFWFRPIYNAFRSDSSFNFFAYFFIFFMQFCVNIIQCLGIAGSGTVGFVTGFSYVGSNVGVGLLLLFVGVLFAMVAGASMFLLFKVHRIYRASGASFAKAQEEFARGVFTNPTVIRGATQMAQGGGR